VGRRLLAVWWGIAVAIYPFAKRVDGAQSSVTYRIERQSDDGRPLSQFLPGQIAILEKLNRADREHLRWLPELVVPDDWFASDLPYSPMPASYEEVAAVSKAVVVYVPAQVFGAYERGALVRWGPVASGGENTPTPPGVYHLNWKSRGHRSTVNPEWFMPWSFNFGNEQGLSFHEYSMPGLPASHGCVRLLHRDARWLYDWGEEWTLDASRTIVRKPGTLVLMIGAYGFASAPPWRSLTWLAESIRLPARDDVSFHPSTGGSLCS
jgi:L,D-transpeptidase-like protein